MTTQTAMEILIDEEKTFSLTFDLLSKIMMEVNSINYMLPIFVVASFAKKRKA